MLGPTSLLLRRIGARARAKARVIFRTRRVDSSPFHGWPGLFGLVRIAHVRSPSVASAGCVTSLAVAD